MHNQNIVHGDLKLDNMMITSQMEIKIADFGVASYVTSSNMSG
jgi:serine/threonine protein kinase